MITSVLSAVQASVLASDGARVPFLVHRPVRPRGWLVWAHGGSWQRGSALMWAPLTRALAAASGWAVVSVDYRLAPAHRFPAAVLDMLAALGWAEWQALGLPVAVGGDSAGGTLAALAALARRDLGDQVNLGDFGGLGGPVPPQVLAYPPLDPECALPSYGTAHAYPTGCELRAAWRLWLAPTPPTQARCHPNLHNQMLFSSTPFQAATLAGLAPVALVVGGEDSVRDDVLTYATRLQTDGVQTSLQVLPGVGHADLLTPRSRVLPELVLALSALASSSSPSLMRRASDPSPMNTPPLKGHLP